jgi:CHAT domain-containing protein
MSVDEALSLPSSMLQAGIPAVIGSLWTVNEFFTAILITLFFIQWRQNGLPAPKALAKAQSTLRDSIHSEKSRNEISQILSEKSLALLNLNMDLLAHPYYWAAFTYTGV